MQQQVAGMCKFSSNSKSLFFSHSKHAKAPQLGNRLAFPALPNAACRVQYILAVRLLIILVRFGAFQGM